MVVEPELDERVRIRILEPGFAEMVEARYCGLLRVGDQAVNRFLPIDVGLMFEVTAERVAHWFEQEHHDRDHEYESDESGAGRDRRHIVAALDSPAHSEATYDPLREAG